MCIKSQRCAVAILISFLAVSTSMVYVSAVTYARKICTFSSETRGLYNGAGNDKITASDGNVLPVLYDCDGSDGVRITDCSLAGAKVFKGSTQVVKTDIGAKFYELTCNKYDEPDLKPADVFVKFCTGSTADKNEVETSGDKQTGPSGQIFKDSTDDIKLPLSTVTVPVVYGIDCDQPIINNCTFAGGNRLTSVVTVAGGSKAYIVVNGTDYMLKCEKQKQSTIAEVFKKEADELCSDSLSAAWETTVKSDYSSYPSKDQLVQKEDNISAPYSALKITYEVKCFDGPAEIQGCIYAGKGRLQDQCCHISYFNICEEAILQKMKQRAKTGNSFSLDDKEETTKVIKVTRPSVGTKLSVEMKALCFGLRPTIKSCRMKRKDNDKVVTAGGRGDCVDISIGVNTSRKGLKRKTMRKLNCNFFIEPDFWRC